MIILPKRIYTEQQERAINARGGSVLVSAAAGSGKTSVLTERVIRLITDKSRQTSHCYIYKGICGRNETKNNFRTSGISQRGFA